MFNWEKSYRDHKIQKSGTDQEVAYLNTESSTYAMAMGAPSKTDTPIIAHTNV